ncbi:MAG: hypothetical protein ABIP80_00560 [Ferruginibacter sp.]
MAINLLEKTTEALGFAPLQKMDPNTPHFKNNDAPIARQQIAQAVIPAVLAGISQLSKSEEGINKILSGAESGWPEIIFGGHRQEIAGNIAGFAMSDFQTTEQAINEAAVKAVKLIKENITDTTGNNAQLKDFIKSQRDNILPYLPAQLHLGEFLNNSTIDDNTNKMEGPVSSLMHKIQAGFGGNETEEDADEKSKKV